ncbi:cytoplasmic protein [Candidatus Magnetoovum chiemensis]|nr:cytoplasmic protein [Candidatus Magnetoovum chiemensis]
MIKCGECENYRKYFREILERARTDEDFKKQFVENPKAILKSYNVTVPDDIVLKVVENRDNIVHFVLPTSGKRGEKHDVKKHWTSECFDDIYKLMFSEKTHISWDELQQHDDEIYK